MLTIDMLRDKYAGEIAGDTIKGRLIEWAIDSSDVEDVITRLQEVDCAGCSSPAPIYYTDMAAELAKHFGEVQDSLDDYEDSMGQKWVYKSNFLETLWFAYEYAAHNLADTLRAEVEESQEAA